MVSRKKVASEFNRIFKRWLNHCVWFASFKRFAMRRKKKSFDKETPGGDDKNGLRYRRH